MNVKTSCQAIKVGSAGTIASTSAQYSVIYIYTLSRLLLFVRMNNGFGVRVFITA